MRRRRSMPFDDSVDDGGLINLTPLLDVLFVVLILFILIAPLLEIDRVELAQTQEQTVDKREFQNPSKIKIVVQADNSITLNDKPIALAELKTGLILLKRERSSTTPQLFHDKAASFGTYQTIKNQVEACGFTDLDIILKK